jgi:ABC-type branched-subunit amino acid transport system ATPase component/ABC-type branched-subunit amino acid transport system permease subunit
MSNAFDLENPPLPRTIGIVVAGTALYVGGSWLVQDRYYQLILTIVPIWAAVGVAFNLFSGYSGLLSFGHAAFFGIGAYTVALLFVMAGVSPWIGIVVAGAVGGLAGLVIGYPTFRLRGHYFALAMLAYPLVLLYLFQWLGYQEVSLPMVRESAGVYMQFADQRIYILIASLLLAGSLAINLAIARSRFGLSLLAIKQNEPAAMAAGINPLVWKLKAIMLSASLTAIIGGFYAVVQLIVTPESVFGLLVSSRALIVTLFGGIGTVAGPIVGALVLIPLGEILHVQLANVLPGIQGVVLGIAIIAVVLLAPDGILPWVLARIRRKDVTPAAGALQLDSVPFVREAHAQPHQRGASILEVRDISVSFGGLQALQNVSFDVHAGEILGIIGPNGAGKTTLFNALNGFILPNKGRVRFQDHELVGRPAFEICRAGIGRTFQIVRPFAGLSVLRNVVVGAFAHQADEDAAYEEAQRALNSVGLVPRQHVLASSLTTIELRLMELARALASGPRLLLLDEILAGLGAGEVEHMLRAIESIRREGVTVVIIEHTMHAMVRLADRLLVLDHGEVLATGEPQKVINLPAVIEAYLGKRWAARAAA